MVKSIDEYVEKWEHTAERYLKIGLYEWAEELINSYTHVLEIGCGCGQSTLTLLRTNHIVFAIDNKIECINRCCNLIESEDFSVEKISLDKKISFSDCDVTLLELDFLSEDSRFLNYLDAEVIILWNPGGFYEYQDNWSIIERSIYYAKDKNIPLMIMNRFEDREKESDFWLTIKKDYNMVLKSLKSKIVQADSGELSLYDENGKCVNKIYLSIGLLVAKT